MHKVVITGSDGFIGKNLVARLGALNLSLDINLINRQSSREQWRSALAGADYVFHLAGTNRAKGAESFVSGNVSSSALLCECLSQSPKPAKVVFSSSIKAGDNDLYGSTKLEAEQLLAELEKQSIHSVQVLRLPNVFGKWCKPHYNSAVATFCYQLTRGQSLTLNQTNPLLKLMYIDDLIDIFIDSIVSDATDLDSLIDTQTFEISLYSLADTLTKLNEERTKGYIPNLAVALEWKLYSTLISYLPESSVVTRYARNADSRGVFAEIIKGDHVGQFAYLTSKPGEVRGNHYHHSKIERFIVVSGKAKFGFECVQTGARFTIVAGEEDGKIIETPPGFSHSIKNVGSSDLVVILWANEIFDPNRPDTVHHLVEVQEAT